MKICLAGTSSFQNLIDIDKSDFLLESFYYVKDWQLPYIKKAKLFLMDSGAFSFMNGKKISIEEVDGYIEKYGKYVRENQIKHYLNVDMDTVWGVNKSLELRRKLEKIVGWKCIPVFHKCMGLEEYKKLIEEYDYIAIGTIYEFSKNIQVLKTLLRMAKQKRCKVHGLGYTRISLLQEMPFYSVDSTAWTCGNRFGYIYQFDGKTLQKHNKVKMSQRVKAKETLNNNWEEWCKFQKFMSFKGE